MKGGVIIVEGNIGVGKSTFAQHLADALEGEYLAEPDEKTNPYLADYYRDPGRWAFEMQMFLLTKRFRAQKHAQSMVRHRGAGFVVMDRSYYGDVCFANVQKKTGCFSDRDYDTYMRHHADMKAYLEPPAAAFFLDAGSKVCAERITRRMSEREGRRCESGIGEEYLNLLQAEIDLLARNMSHCTTVTLLRWEQERSGFEIGGICANLAEKIKKMPESVYDFWTGTEGIGR